MGLGDVMDQQNPSMTQVWKAAGGHFKKWRNMKARKKILIVDTTEVCDAVNKCIGSQEKRLDSRTYYKSSMIVSGTLRLHNMQTSILLDDTKKLLTTMRKEKLAMKQFDNKLDCPVSLHKLMELGKLESPAKDGRHPATPRTTCLATTSIAGRALEMDWTTLEGDIDWTMGPPRACVQDITMVDNDATPSFQYLAEMEQLRAIEGTLDGPTLIDWEDMNGEGLPKAGEEKMDENITEAPIDVLAPEEAQHPPLPQMVIGDEPMEPPTLEEQESAAAPQPQASPPPEAPAGPEPHEEQPSQIELAPLEEEHRRRQARVRPIIDPVTITSSSAMKIQIARSLDTMRCKAANEDILNLQQVESYGIDFFTAKPLHRRVMADVLLDLFRPCEREAPIRPESPLGVDMEEIGRGALDIEERDVLSVPTIFQDTTEDSSRSRSTLMTEAVTGLHEDTHGQLHPIEELQTPVSPPRQLPLTEVPPSTTKEQGASKKHEQEKKGKKTSPHTRHLEAPPEEPVAGPELEQEEVPCAEPRADLSMSSEQSIIEVDVMASMVLEHLQQHPETFFNDLLPENPKDRDGAQLFVLLMLMYKNRLLELEQDHAFAPIAVRQLPGSDE